MKMMMMNKDNQWKLLAILKKEFPNHANQNWITQVDTSQPILLPSGRIGSKFNTIDNIHKYYGYYTPKAKDAYIVQILVEAWDTPWETLDEYRSHLDEILNDFDVFYPMVFEN